MYNRYRRCCCQNNYNPKVIETICNEAGTTAQFANNMKMHMHMTDDKCECGFDEEPSFFPAKSYACTKLCSNSNNGQNIYTMLWIKNGYNISRIS